VEGREGSSEVIQGAGAEGDLTVKAGMMTVGAGTSTTVATGARGVDLAVGLAGNLWTIGGSAMTMGAETEDGTSASTAGAGTSMATMAGATIDPQADGMTLGESDESNLVLGELVWEAGGPIRAGIVAVMTAAGAITGVEMGKGEAANAAQASLTAGVTAGECCCCCCQSGVACD
jgi:hypothetical protein